MTTLIVIVGLFAVSVRFDMVDVAIGVAAGALAGLLAWWRSAAAHHKVSSTRSGTTLLMFILGWLSGVGGPIAGVVFMVHTSAPGCDGWVGCGTNHSLMGAGVLCIVAGLVLAAVFGAIGLIARSVGEMQAVQESWLNPLDPGYTGQRAEYQ